MNPCWSRREFLKRTAAGAAALSTLGLAACGRRASAEPLYKISLAEWSLNKSIRGGSLDHLDFAAKARNDFGLDAIEYVSTLFARGTDSAYIAELKKRASDHGVRSLLIMIDREGRLGDTDAGARRQAVENHYKWIDAAAELGCHSIRVNASDEGSREEVAAAATESLTTLCEYGQKAGINVLVENHGGYSSDGGWLAGVMERVGMDNCGTLPDFGNFCLEYERLPEGGRRCLREYDKYKGMDELMPYAKAVSAKSHEFDAQGNEVSIDYRRMMKIVLDHGYHGYVGIEYEGPTLSEDEGIIATRDLLTRVREEMAKA